MRVTWSLVMSLSAACWSASSTPPTSLTATVATPAPPRGTIGDVAWLAGHWQGDDGTERWVEVDGAMYGVALGDRGSFEVMIIDDAAGPGPADGILRFAAMPGGARPVVFVHRTWTGPGPANGTSIEVHNASHDEPKTIQYARTGDALTVTLDPERGDSAIRFAFLRVEVVPSPELEAADRTFAADTGTRGLDGLMSWFASDAWMWGENGELRGPELRQAWAGRFAVGSLSWEPIASGRRGDVGYTIGRGRFAGHRREDDRRTTYATIWKRQPDGAWRVVFDTGRVVNEK